MRYFKYYFLAACMAFLCFSCSPAINEVEDDHVYTEAELAEKFGVHIITDWKYAGTSEVYNETGRPVKMTISYGVWNQKEDLTVVINPGECASLKIGAMEIGDDFSVCSKAAFTLEDGTEIVVTPGKGGEWPDAWSEYFLTNFDVQDDYEIVELNVEGKPRKLRHDLLLATYHINDTLVNLWRSAH